MDLKKTFKIFPFAFLFETECRTKLLKETLCSHYFCNFQKRGPRLKWTIHKHVSDNSKKNSYLSVGNFRILFVVCSASAAYTSLCRGLKYLLKVRYVILVYSNVAEILISNAVFFIAGYKQGLMSEDNGICVRKTQLHQTFTECVSN